MRRTVMFRCVLLALLTVAPVLHAQYSSINRHAVFNGSSYISVPQSPALNGMLSQMGMITIDAWIYPTSYAGYPTIVGNDYTAGYWLGLNPSGNVRFYPGGGSYRESSGSVPLNQWTHVAVTYAAQTSVARFYINGALDATHSNFGTGVGSSNGDLRIGADRQGGSPAYYFNGRIDEVRIWDTPIDFSSTTGALHRIPQQWRGGVYGSSLVSAWRLNGDATDSTSLLHGNPVGAVTYSGTGNPPHYSRICSVLYNKSVGHDFFSIPHTAEIGKNINYTLECLVYSFGPGAATTYQTIFLKGMISNNAFSYWLGLNLQNGKLRFCPTGNFAQALEGGVVPSNAWTHVAATYSGSSNNGTARIYVNGSEVGQTVFTSSGPVVGTPLLIGTANPQTTPANAMTFYGRIDEARIWSVVRSVSEIGNTKYIEIGNAVAGLAGCWQFNGDIQDRSGNDAHGTNSNSASTTLYFEETTAPALATLSLNAPNGGESVTMGDKLTVSWTASGLATLRVLLSRDGGASWSETLAASVPASSGGMTWIATGPATSTAKVRVETTSLPLLADASNTNFTIAEPPPVLLVSPLSLSFAAARNGPLPSAKTLYISNTGGGSLIWNAAAPAGWLSILPSTGVSSPDSVLVIPTTTALAAGLHRDTIVFGGNAVNAPRRIPVEYSITSNPRLDPQPPDLSFTMQPGLNPPPQYVRIRNSGAGILQWSAGTSTPWISLVGTPGGDGDSVRVEIAAAALPLGTYSGGVVFSGNAENAPLVVPVQLVISAAQFYEVSGQVVYNDQGLEGVRITATGDTSLVVSSGTDGTFSFGPLRAGSYTVTPSHPLFDFSPQRHTIPVLTAPRDDMFFNAGPRSGSAWLHYSEGWNLFSLPLDPAVHSVAALLPDASPAKAWRYAPDTGYVEVADLVFGTGYWARFSKTDSVLLTGTLKGVQELHVSGLGGGWNLIGTVSGALPYASLSMSPPERVLVMYQFNTGEGYRLPASGLLRPGRGYFVKVSGDGVLRLRAEE